MSVRPIDANALYDALRDNEFQTFCPLDEVDDVIAAAPTLDYAPVRHGEWEKHTLWFGSWGENQMTCSECQKRYPFHAEYNFCPNCGAKMDAKEEPQ